MKPIDCEVAVVGAGPAGSRAALRLAEAGRDVVLLDENDRPRRGIVCTGIVGREAFERFDLPETAVRDTVRRARFCSPSGVAVPYEPDQCLAHVVDRTEFDRALAEEARKAGARLRRGHAARAVEKTPGEVRVRCRTADGDREITAQALVVATGHQRWLHEEAGLGVPQDYVHGVHADLPFEDIDGAELYFGNDVAPGFFAWAVGYGQSTARLGVLAPQGSRRLFREFLRRSEIRDRIPVSDDELGDRVDAGLRSRGIVQGAVSPSVADRVVAVGEAAGQVKTTTAGGIYYGMIGSEIAAQVLDERLPSDGLEASSLRVYQERWWNRLGGEIRAGLELQRLGREMSDQEIDSLFDGLRRGMASTIRRVVRFDWHRPALRVLLESDRLWSGLSVRSPMAAVGS